MAKVSRIISIAGDLTCQPSHEILTGTTVYIKRSDPPDLQQSH